MRDVILFGAGASYSSNDVIPYPPPLGGKYLYNDIKNCIFLINFLPKETKEVFYEDFEKGMDLYYEYTGGEIISIQRRLAFYFAKFKPGIDNNFIKLINKIKNNYIICTLNYDLLIEESSWWCDYNYRYDLIKDSKFINVLKLHGSCNFWPDLQGFTISNATFKKSGRADIQAKIKPLDRLETIQQCVEQDSVAPAMAVYAKDKSVKISPDFVEWQQYMWSLALGYAKNVYIFGAGINLHDTHIWQPIENTRANINYFGVTDSDKAKFNEWYKTINKNNLFFNYADFDSFLSIFN